MKVYNTNMTHPKILIVEDEKDIRELIHFHLLRAHYDVVEASDGVEALDVAFTEKPDLIILDIMLPKIDGIEVCKTLRANPDMVNTKIIFLSAKGEENNIIEGLDLGGDDYITKPFSPKVLLARIKSVLRRDMKSNDAIVELHGIKLDISKKRVWIDAEEVSFSATELQLIKLFLEKPGHVFTRGQIVDSIRGHNHAVTDRSVDTQLVSLRKKLGEKGKLIETVWGIGYRFKEYEA